MQHALDEILRLDLHRHLSVAIDIHITSNLTILRDGAGPGRTISGNSGYSTKVCWMITAGLAKGVLPAHAVQHEISEAMFWQPNLPSAQPHADIFFFPNRPGIRTRRSGSFCPSPTK